MKKTLILMITLTILLSGCGNTVTPVVDEESEKRTEMLPSGVLLYMTQMTNSYSSAFTVAASKEQKNEYLNKAITDINLTVYEIEDEYEKGTSPVDELLELAEKLKLLIDAEMLGDRETAYDYSVVTGEIIGELSREYLDGELPTGIRIMTGLDDAN